MKHLPNPLFAMFCFLLAVAYVALLHVLYLGVLVLELNPFKRHD